MCRNIKQLYNYDPPASEAEIRAASLQFVRKLTGLNKPSSVNEFAFEKAVDEVSNATQKLLSSLITNAQPKNRELEAERARARSAKRFPKL